MSYRISLLPVGSPRYGSIQLATLHGLGAVGLVAVVPYPRGAAVRPALQLRVKLTQNIYGKTRVGYKLCESLYNK